MNPSDEKILSEIKLGILGGGQLGKMLVNAANQWSVHTFIMDPAADCPAAHVCGTFIKGDFTNYNDVYAFGQLVDVVTIEIENVNADALLQLKSEGKLVFPEPEKLQIIKDKGLQKQFYTEHNIPTSSYVLYENKKHILKSVEDGSQKLPFVQKTREAGYDGRGVMVVKSKENLLQLLDGASLVEELVPIQKELAVIVARNIQGEVAVYPAVEMSFNPSANLVEYLISPAQIDSKIADEAKDLALAVMNAFKLTGLLAVEMFLDENNKIYVNEVAPRPHNSGHQSIENIYTSQYEQHLRSVLGLPLGSTQLIAPSIMLNLLGEPGYSGLSRVVGLQESMILQGVNIHLYGKKETRPYRKMGHVTIVDSDLENAKKKADIVQKTLKIIS